MIRRLAVVGIWGVLNQQDGFQVELAVSGLVGAPATIEQVNAVLASRQG
jgi:hypothetical protein